MRVLAVALAFLLWPAAALADDAVTIVSRDVPLHAKRALASAHQSRFDMVGLHWQGRGTPAFRTRSIATGRWSPWLSADDDWGRAGVWRKSNPEWTGTADAIQYRLRGTVRRLRAYFLWSPVEKIPLRRISIAGSPSVVPRSSWGADESIRRAPPLYASSLAFALVHHTVNTNDYTPAESAAIVRGIYVYHVKGNGWNDIGYNFLVDRYGQVFEGRFGGIDKNVVGAHSQGFNTGSVGVAVIGTFNSTAIPSAARKSLEQVLAWRLDLAHINPLATLNYLSGGNSKFPAGVPVFLRAISGHRDTYFTDCPGNTLYAQLPGIAGDIAALGLPKLYSPLVSGSIGGPVRFTAKLSNALPWTVTVVDAKGATAATGGGMGASVDWTWDATAALPGRYSWTISGGPTLRSASGTIGAKLPPLAVTAPAANPPVLSPNGDGVADSAAVTYTLSVAAEVTATLVDRSGVMIASLFDQQQPAGKQSFTLAPDPSVPEGDYTLVLSAKTAGGEVAQVSIPIVIDRTVTAFSVSPTAISPNGDGVQDVASFTLSLTRPAHLHLAIVSGGQELAVVTDGQVAAGDVTAAWTATGPAKIPDGRYSAVLTEDDGVTRSVPLVVDTTPPKLRLVSVARRRVSVSEPALLTLGAKQIQTTKAATITLPRWNHGARLVAQDAAGNRSTLRLP